MTFVIPCFLWSELSSCVALRLFHKRSVICRIFDQKKIVINITLMQQVLLLMV